MSLSYYFKSADLTDQPVEPTIFLQLIIISIVSKRWSIPMEGDNHMLNMLKATDL